MFYKGDNSYKSTCKCTFVVLGKLNMDYKKLREEPLKSAVQQDYFKN